MATIEQIKALVRAHLENNNEKFKAIVLQIAAHEAKIGHTSSARELKEIIQDPKYYTNNKIIKLKTKHDILEQRYPDFTLLDLAVSEELEFKIKRIIKEYKQMALLRKRIKNRSKILLVGKPGTGKTMTASVISLN